VNPGAYAGWSEKTPVQAAEVVRRQFLADATFARESATAAANYAAEAAKNGDNDAMNYHLGRAAAFNSMHNRIMTTARNV
jgi:hypothetical protein